MYLCVYVCICMCVYECLYMCMNVYACMCRNVCVCICMCVCVMRDHVFGMSRNINSFLAATVDEKDMTTKARELTIASLFLSHFIKYKRI